MTKIKICGLTSLEDARLINSLPVSYAGVVMFFPKSHRSCTEQEAKEILSALSPDIQTVAVMVSPTVEQLLIAKDLGFSIVQIHGALPQLPDDFPLPVWKAFQSDELDGYDSYAAVSCLSGYVFDAAAPGSGKTFDWNTLSGLSDHGRLRILAGGLTAENVGAAIRATRPDVVDVSSYVERQPKTRGKDAKRLAAFVQAVSATD